MNQSWQIGDTRITRIEELTGPLFDPTQFFPDYQAEVFEKHRHWLYPNHCDEASGRIIASMHSWLIQTPHHNILVDGCIGDDKERMPYRNWHRMQTPWLANFTAAGLAPEDIDFVLCTHLHVDHVGWNTRLQDGKWVPTFPNAKYLFAKKEWEFWKGEYESGRDNAADGGSIADSVVPIVEAGKAELVEGDHQIDDELHLEPSPGHTPGHVFLHLQSSGKRAIMTGDIMHHPVQCSEPQWNSGFCVNPPESAATRRKFLETYSEQDVIVLAAHFLAPNGGRIVPNGETWKLQI